jgi:hypothetical protein
VVPGCNHQMLWNLRDLEVSLKEKLYFRLIYFIILFKSKIIIEFILIY